MSDSLQPHGLQYARLLCSSLSPGVYSNSCLLSWRWYLNTIPSSAAPSPFTFSLSQHQVFFFSSELTLPNRWPKYWSFNFSNSPSNEYSGLISFRVDWFDLFAVQETLKSPLQHHSPKASILQRSAFFLVQLSHLYMTTGKSIALTIWTFVSKVMSLLFNTLPRFIIAFLPKSKLLLISWLQSMPMTFFEARENKIGRYFHFFPICLLWSDGTRCCDLSFLNVEF